MIVRPATPRVLASALAATALVSGLAGAPAPVRAVGTTPSVTELQVIDLNPKPDGYATDLVALVSPSDATGTVTFYDDDGVSRTEIGSGTLGVDPLVLGRTIATYTVPADQANGTYHVVAVYSGNDVYAGSEGAPVTFVVGPRPSTTQITLTGPHDGSGATAQKFDIVTASVQVIDAGQFTPNPFPISGSVAIKRDGVTVATVPPNTSIDLPTALWSLGSHTVQAAFISSDAVFTGSSGQTTISILANQVEASGVTVQYSTFYPYKDGYRDTNALRGLRLETASVAIRVTSSTGKVVKSAAIPSGVGSWSVVWNGRTSAGTQLAAGTYKVVQTVTDSHGTKRAFTNYVVLSAKRLYTYTATYTKNATTQTARKTATWAAWAFSLPSATVYKSLVFSIYGRDTFGTGGFGPHDFTWCSAGYWDPGCATRWKTFPAVTSWKSVTGSTTRDRSGRSVRLYAWGGSGNTIVIYGRVKVTYGILR